VVVLGFFAVAVVVVEKFSADAEALPLYVVVFSQFSRSSHETRPLSSAVAKSVESGMNNFVKLIERHRQHPKRHYST